MTTEQLHKARKYLEHKKNRVLVKVSPGSTVPAWVKEEIAFLDWVEQLANNNYNLSQELEALKKRHSRLIELAELLERAFFGFVPLRHEFKFYNGTADPNHIRTITLLSLFSVLPEQDRERKKQLIDLINEHIKHPVAPQEGYSARLKRTTFPSNSDNFTTNSALQF